MEGVVSHADAYDGMARRDADCVLEEAEALLRRAFPVLLRREDRREPRRVAFWAQGEQSCEGDRC
jgi:hypothetical protein